MAFLGPLIGFGISIPRTSEKWVGLDRVRWCDSAPLSVKERTICLSLYTRSILQLRMPSRYTTSVLIIKIDHTLDYTEPS